MRKKDKLYTINKHNMPLFADVDREHQNIFDGLNSSSLANWDKLASKAYGANYGDEGFTLNDYMNSTNSLGISKKNNPFSKGNIGSTLGALGSFQSGGYSSGSSDTTGSIFSGAVSGLQSGGIGGGPNGVSMPWGSIASGAIQGGMNATLETKYGKMSTTGGDIVTGLGGSVLSAGVDTMNPLLMMAGAGLMFGGTAWNSLYGSALNEKGIQQIQQDNAKTHSTAHGLGNAATTSDVLNQWGNVHMGRRFDKGVIGIDGTYSHKAEDKYNELLNKQNKAIAYATHGQVMGAKNADYNLDSLAQVHSSALGGPIKTRKYKDNMKDNILAFGGLMDYYNNPIENSMGAIQYDLMTDYLATKKQNAQNRNQMTNMFMGTPSSMFDFGGTLQSNGGDYGTGLVHIDAGLSHEMNPNDGVQMGIDSEGTPNLVEEGEVVFNDYVFSNRINIDDHTKALLHFPKKKDITYAEAAKKLENEIKERPNDPISEAGFKAQMQKLEEQQERQKADMEAARAREAFEALSPEEQTAVMQQAAQQEAMAQQTAQQQAMAQQQQEQMMQADGSQAMLGQKPPQFGNGGGIVKGANGLIDYDKTLIDLPEITVVGSKKNIKKPEVVIDPTISKEGVEAMIALQNLQEIDRQQKQDELMKAIQEELEEKKLDRELLRRNRIHYYANGGLKEKIYKYLGIKTDSEFRNWVEKQGTSGQGLAYDVINDLLDKGDWDTLRRNELFVKSLAGDDAAMKDALSKGYDFGLYKPEGATNKKYLWDQFWEPTNEYSRQAGNAENKYRIDKTYKGDIKDLEDSDEYKEFTDYILNSASDKERMDYFKWIDDNTGRKNKYINNGKLVDDWKEMYQAARNDGKYGIQHYVPTMGDIQRGAESGNYLINDDGTIEKIYGDTADLTAAGNYTWASPENDYTYNYYKRPAPATIEDPAIVKVENPQNPTRKVVPDLKNENLRYVGLLGPAVGLGMMAAGIGKPDVSGLEAAARSAGDVNLATWMPRGDFAKYTPDDPWFYTMPILAQAGATQRAIENKIAPSKDAETIANGYNTMIALGNAQRQQLDSNYDKYMKTKQYNGTIYDANQREFGQTSRFNASARNEAGRAASQLAFQAAREKLDADTGWYNSLYGNVAGLFKGIGDLGRENAQHNMIARMGANGLYGTATPDTPVFQDFLKWQEEQKKEGKTKSKGGKNHKKHDIIL